MNDRIIIIGGFHEIIELAEELNLRIVGLIDNEKIGTYYSYQVLGTDYDIDILFKQYSHLPLLITPDEPLLREALYLKYQSKGFLFTSLISKNAKISK